MGKSDVKLDKSQLLSALKQNGEAFYMYFYKNYVFFDYAEEEVHIKICKKLETMDILCVTNLCIEKLDSMIENKIGSVIYTNEKDFVHCVMCLVENGILPNDDANGYLKITADEELLSKPLKLLRKNLRNIEIHRFGNECNLCMKESSDSPVSKPKERKKSTTTKTTEDVQLYSNLPEPITRKTTMSDKEKASREKCPSCGSIKCNGDWETYKKTLPPKVQNSKNELKRRKEAFAKKH